MVVPTSVNKAAKSLVPGHYEMYDFVWRELGTSSNHHRLVYWSSLDNIDNNPAGIKCHTFCWLGLFLENTQESCTSFKNKYILKLTTWAELAHTRRESTSGAYTVNKSNQISLALWLQSSASHPCIRCADRPSQPSKMLSPCLNCMLGILKSLKQFLERWLPVQVSM